MSSPATSHSGGAPGGAASSSSSDTVTHNKTNKHEPCASGEGQQGGVGGGTPPTRRRGGVQARRLAQFPIRTRRSKALHTPTAKFPFEKLVMMRGAGYHGPLPPSRRAAGDEHASVSPPRPTPPPPLPPPLQRGAPSWSIALPGMGMLSRSSMPIIVDRLGCQGRRASSTTQSSPLPRAEHFSL